eukprot:g2872.t1
MAAARAPLTNLMDLSKQLPVRSGADAKRKPLPQVELDVSESKAGAWAPDKAPLAMITKFLGCVMEEDYEAAFTLSEQILKQEPGNAIIQQYQPVLQAKLKLDAEAADGEDEEGEASGEDEDEDDEDEDEDDDEDGRAGGEGESKDDESKDDESKDADSSDEDSDDEEGELEGVPNGEAVEEAPPLEPSPAVLQAVAPIEEAVDIVGAIGGPGGGETVGDGPGEGEGESKE